MTVEVEKLSPSEAEGLRAKITELERKLATLSEQVALDRIRILRCEEVFVADQRAFVRLTEHLSNLEVRIIESVDRLDAHLEEHIKRCGAHKKEERDGIKTL